MNFGTGAARIPKLLSVAKLKARSVASNIQTRDFRREASLRVLSFAEAIFRKIEVDNLLVTLPAWVYLLFR